MKKKKRNTKRPRQQNNTLNPSAQQSPLTKPVRLSQCMIVKNEEKNIEKALSWAKDVAFEQIVVDTGSTDHTVEIAERMGAKVYHFDWINDFSAAKNYAISLAKGNWIAFLDADEYFSAEDTKKLMELLNKAHTPKYNSIDAFLNTLVNLDDKNQPFATLEQIRVFRNRADIHYNGRIHELLTLSPSKVSRFLSLNIMHTGYAKGVYDNTEKIARNIELLRKELETDPDNPDLMSYLSDSLIINSSPEHLAEAYALYQKALNNGQFQIPLCRLRAYSLLIPHYLDNPEKLDEAEDLCQQAIEHFPGHPDFTYMYACLLNRRGEHERAWEMLLLSEKALMGNDFFVSSSVLNKPAILFYEMITTAQALNDNANVIKYATILLREDKYQPKILVPYLRMLSSEARNEEILSLLTQLYDFNNVKDKFLASQAAKTAGNAELAQTIFSLITPEEQQWLPK